ncbi:MAG: SDR family oxidoreductase [Parcubacteria group bacterium]|nr:SDR family oxidoreductase [Parcubacteria group bacterium]
MKTMMLEGKTAIIAGASRGIGRAIAKRFFEEGADIIAIARYNSDDLSQLISEMRNRKCSNKIIALLCDISQEGQVREAFDFIGNRKNGKIDILVNTAGIAEPYAPIFESEFLEWKKVFETNVFGTFLMMKYTILQMRENKSGKIINFSGGGDGLEGFSAYSASKVAIVRLTETVAKEVKPFGIDINVIAPGPVHTKLFADMFFSKTFLESKNAPPATGDIQKSVELALFLASDKSNGLSGKFLSANWDNWSKIPENLDLIMSEPNVFTLRRVKGEL